MKSAGILHMSTIKPDTLYLTGLFLNPSGFEDFLLVPVFSAQSFSHCNVSGVLVTSSDGSLYFLPSSAFTYLSISFVDPLCNIFTSDTDFNVIEEIPSYFAFEGNSDQGGLF